MTEVMAPPAERPVTKTRCRSRPWAATRWSTICRIDSGSPPSRAKSCGRNQLKQRGGVVGAPLLGQQQGEASSPGEVDQPVPAS
ncbi:MAG: hypothetical protein U1E43_04535 [Rhodospirillales bacterium]